MARTGRAAGGRSFSGESGVAAAVAGLGPRAAHSSWVALLARVLTCFFGHGAAGAADLERGAGAPEKKGPLSALASPGLPLPPLPARLPWAWPELAGQWPAAGPGPLARRLLPAQPENRQARAARPPKDIVNENEKRHSDPKTGRRLQKHENRQPNPKTSKHGQHLAQKNLRK